jgi:hypothetical protein
MKTIESQDDNASDYKEKAENNKGAAKIMHAEEPC